MEGKIYVGIDLHKTQFTICIITSGSVLEEGTRFEMNKDGYRAFISLMRHLSSSETHDDIIMAIESTANSRFFRDLMASSGFKVIVVNTLRFKVVNLSTKKTDKNDARTLAEFLSKDILPVSHLCSAESEALRRIIKSRNLMVLVDEEKKGAERE